MDPFSAWSLPALDPAAFAALAMRERLLHLAGWALLAPSTHNTVPVRFSVSADALGVWIDRAAVLPESDAVGRQALVSAGCAIENAAVAARALGAIAEVATEGAAETDVRQGNGAVRVATVRLRAGDGEPLSGRWLDAMRARKVVRAEYDERVKLEPAVGDELGRETAALHAGLTLHLLTDAPTRIFLGKFQELADSTVINRPGFARELGDWLLPNDSESPVGMRGREFGLSDESAARMHRGLKGEERLLPDETAGFAKAGNVGMRSATAVAVITAAKDDLAHRIAAGRAYERLALRLALDGFCTAMHAGITEVEAPNLALRGRLRTMQRPTVVFRLGKPLTPKDGERPHSSRPPLDSLLVDG